MTGYAAPVLLGPHHNLSTFTCRSAEQTSWLRDHARQSSAVGTTRVHVVTPLDSHEVVAYYGWCMASVAIEDVPPRVRRGAGLYPQPVALLARLGVASAHEGHGVGAGLLHDVLTRTVTLGDVVGCRGLIVHAESEEARTFYAHLIPEFESSPTDPLHLVLLMKDIRKTLR